MTALVRYEAARSALAEAQKVDEVKDIRDKAEAMAAYARQAKDSELIQYATEIKVRAERRCGELLALTERAQPKNNLKRGPKSNDTTSGPTLAQMGLTKDESSRYQKLAAMPEEHFEVAIATAKSSVGEVTTARMLREAKKAAPATTKATGKKQSPKSALVAVEPEEPGDDGLTTTERAADLHRELEVAMATAAEFEKAMNASDEKAEIARLVRRLEHSARRQEELMADAASFKRRADFYERQLARCGKAVGQRDLDKVAAAVEALARAQKVAA